MKKFFNLKIILFFFLSYFNCIDIYAAKHSKSIPIEASLVVDAKNGKILYSHNADTKIKPASLTKLMTIYQAFKAIEEGKITMNTQLKVSKNAAHMSPTKLGLKAGEKISTIDAINSLIIISANDIAVVLAENLAGSEEKFAKMMNFSARKLGMHNTNFRNASGWHDSCQYSTSIDMAKLALALKKNFPQYYHLFAQTQFKFRGNTYYTHNHVVKKYQGAEGLKTGYTKPSGYNLVTAAKRNDKHLIGVIIGAKSSKTRDMQMINMLDTYFSSTPLTRNKVKTTSNKKNKKII